MKGEFSGSKRQERKNKIFIFLIKMEGIMYIIIRSEDGKFVSKPGSRYSYTNNILGARIYQTVSEAERDKCGNEYIKELRNIIGY